MASAGTEKGGWLGRSKKAAPSKKPAPMILYEGYLQYKPARAEAAFLGLEAALPSRVLNTLREMRWRKKYAVLFENGELALWRKKPDVVRESIGRRIQYPVADESGERSPSLVEKKPTKLRNSRTQQFLEITSPVGSDRITSSPKQGGGVALATFAVRRLYKKKPHVVLQLDPNTKIFEPVKKKEDVDNNIPIMSLDDFCAVDPKAPVCKKRKTDLGFTGRLPSLHEDESFFVTETASNVLVFKPGERDKGRRSTDMGDHRPLTRGQREKWVKGSDSDSSPEKKTASPRRSRHKKEIGGPKSMNVSESDSGFEEKQFFLSVHLLPGDSSANNKSRTTAEAFLFECRRTRDEWAQHLKACVRRLDSGILVSGGERGYVADEARREPMKKLPKQVVRGTKALDSSITERIDELRRLEQRAAEDVRTPTVDQDRKKKKSSLTRSDFSVSITPEQLSNDERDSPLSMKRGRETVQDVSSARTTITGFQLSEKFSEVSDFNSLAGPTASGGSTVASLEELETSILVQNLKDVVCAFQVQAEDEPTRGCAFQAEEELKSAAEEKLIIDEEGLKSRSVIIDEEGLLDFGEQTPWRGPTDVEEELDDEEEFERLSVVASEEESHDHNIMSREEFLLQVVEHFLLEASEEDLPLTMTSPLERQNAANAPAHLFFAAVDCHGATAALPPKIQNNIADSSNLLKRLTRSVCRKSAHGLKHMAGLKHVASILAPLKGRRSSSDHAREQRTRILAEENNLLERPKRRKTVHFSMFSGVNRDLDEDRSRASGIAEEVSDDSPHHAPEAGKSTFEDFWCEELMESEEAVLEKLRANLSRDDRSERAPVTLDEAEKNSRFVVLLCERDLQSVPDQVYLRPLLDLASTPLKALFGDSLRGRDRCSNLTPTLASARRVSHGNSISLSPEDSCSQLNESQALSDQSPASSTQTQDAFFRREAAAFVCSGKNIQSHFPAAANVLYFLSPTKFQGKKDEDDDVLDSTLESKPAGRKSFRQSVLAPFCPRKVFNRGSNNLLSVDPVSCRARPSVRPSFFPFPELQLLSEERPDTRRATSFAAAVELAVPARSVQRLVSYRVVDHSSTTGNNQQWVCEVHFRIPCSREENIVSVRFPTSAACGQFRGAVKTAHNADLAKAQCRFPHSTAEISQYFLDNKSAYLQDLLSPTRLWRSIATFLGLTEYEVSANAETLAAFLAAQTTDIGNRFLLALQVRGLQSVFEFFEDYLFARTRTDIPPIKSKLQSAHFSDFPDLLCIARKHENAELTSAICDRVVLPLLELVEVCFDAVQSLASSDKLRNVDLVLTFLQRVKQRFLDPSHVVSADLETAVRRLGNFKRRTLTAQLGRLCQGVLQRDVANDFCVTSSVKENVRLSSGSAGESDEAFDRRRLTAAEESSGEARETQIVFVEDEECQIFEGASEVVIDEERVSVRRCNSSTVSLLKERSRERLLNFGEATSPIRNDMFEKIFGRLTSSHSLCTRQSTLRRLALELENPRSPQLANLKPRFRKTGYINLMARLSSSESLSEEKQPIVRRATCFARAISSQSSLRESQASRRRSTNVLSQCLASDSARDIVMLLNSTLSLDTGGLVTCEEKDAPASPSLLELPFQVANDVFSVYFRALADYSILIHAHPKAHFKHFQPSAEYKTFLLGTVDANLVLLGTVDAKLELRIRYLCAQLNSCRIEFEAGRSEWAFGCKRELRAETEHLMFGSISCQEALLALEYAHRNVALDQEIGTLTEAVSAVRKDMRLSMERERQVSEAFGERPPQKALRGRELVEEDPFLSFPAGPNFLGKARDQLKLAESAILWTLCDLLTFNMRKKVPIRDFLFVCNQSPEAALLDNRRAVPDVDSLTALSQHDVRDYLACFLAFPLRLLKTCLATKPFEELLAKLKLLTQAVALEEILRDSPGDLMRGCEENADISAKLTLLDENIDLFFADFITSSLECKDSFLGPDERAPAGEGAVSSWARMSVHLQERALSLSEFVEASDLDDPEKPSDSFVSPIAVDRLMSPIAALRDCLRACHTREASAPETVLLFRTFVGSVPLPYAHLRGLVVLASVFSTDPTTRERELREAIAKLTSYRSPGINAEAFSLLFNALQGPLPVRELARLETKDGESNKGSFSGIPGDAGETQMFERLVMDEQGLEVASGMGLALHPSAAFECLVTLKVELLPAKSDRLFSPPQRRYTEEVFTSAVCRRFFRITAAYCEVLQDPDFSWWLFEKNSAYRLPFRDAASVTRLTPKSALLRVGAEHAWTLAFEHPRHLELLLQQVLAANGKTTVLGFKGSNFYHELKGAWKGMILPTVLDPDVAIKDETLKEVWPRNRDVIMGRTF